MAGILDRLAVEWGKFSAELSARKHVLIVDDDEATREVFVRVLDEFDLTCELRKSSEEALEKFEAGKYDCLLVDKNLPGASGVELIREMQKLDRDCEAVLITGYANLDSVLAAIDLRAADYLTKPLDSIDVLPAAIGKALRRRNRRMLARRILADLRDALSEKARDDTLAMLQDARQRVDKFSGSLAQKKRVMLARREMEDLRHAVEWLAGNGFKVIRVDSAEEAIQRSSRGEVNVLVVSDNFEGMTGLQVVDKVVDAEGRPELVFVTAKAGLTDALAAIERGAAGYLVKPFNDVREFLRAVDAACSTHHERLIHYKMVTELTRIVGMLEKRQHRRNTQEQLKATLGEFDVKTAPELIAPFERTPTPAKKT